MSTRALAWAAALLGLLVAAGGVLAADRLGYRQHWDEPQWAWENRLVSVPPGAVMFLRPAREGQPDGRFVFLETVAEPDPEPRLTEPNSNVPNVYLGVQLRHPDGESWQEAKPLRWALDQLGAMTSQEWLLEIRLVREVRENGPDRMLLRVGFAHPTGAQTAYFYDPDPAAPAPPLGWSRTERAGPGEAPEAEFAFDGGIIELASK